MSKGSEFDIYIEEGIRFGGLSNRLKDILLNVKHDVELLIPNSRVYIFGSFARGKYTAISDVDLLIITDVDDVELFDRVKAFLKRKYIDYPFEFHIVSETVYNRWYKRFIPEGELIRV